MKQFALLTLGCSFIFSCGNQKNQNKRHRKKLKNQQLFIQ
jgi:hypothetical protein